MFVKHQSFGERRIWIESWGLLGYRLRFNILRIWALLVIASPLKKCWQKAKNYIFVTFSRKRGENLWKKYSQKNSRRISSIFIPLQIWPNDRKHNVFSISNVYYRNFSSKYIHKICNRLVFWSIFPSDLQSIKFRFKLKKSELEHYMKTSS